MKKKLVQLLPKGAKPSAVHLDAVKQLWYRACAALFIADTNLCSNVLDLAS